MTPIHVLSLGAGVQSSTVALMAAQGEIEPPDCAIFADTGAEPIAVYQWLDWLEQQLPYPVHRVSHGSLLKDSLEVRQSKKSGRHYHKRIIPAFTKAPSGKRGMFQRHCTRDYKINPIRKKLRELVGISRFPKDAPVHAFSWIGISTDEAHRMKPSAVSWIQNWYPLIELGMTRTACLNWMESRGFPRPPRSACIFCPFHSDFEWKRLLEESPSEFEAAVDYERKFQAAQKLCEVSEGEAFLHDSRVPLDQVVFNEDDPKDRMGNECEGMCGV